MMMDRVTVLVVDDELPICNLIRQILLSNGYAVLSASTGEEALSVFYKERQRIGCLLTDCRMPGMSGPQLAERLIQLNPALPVIFMSGADAGLEGYPFLSKPFTPAQIIECLGNVLAGVSGRASSSAATPSNGTMEQERRRCSPSPPHRDRNCGNSLTRREAEVLVLLAAGHSTRTAARQLGIAFKTAANHRARICNKLEVHGLVGLVRYAIRNGIASA